MDIYIYIYVYLCDVHLFDVQRKECRQKTLAQTHLDFVKANGTAAKDTIPGPEANYTDMKPVVDCDDMQ